MNRRATALTAVAAGAAWLAWRNRAGVDLTGKVALVTGGSRGLGFLLAEELLRQGCAVAICARDRSTLDRARAALSGRGGEGAEVLAVQCDVSNADDVAELVDKVVATYGQLDLVINNASTIHVAPLPALTKDDFREAMDITFWGAVHTTFAALPHLRRTRGRIANITSIGAKVAIPHLLPYGCSKFALIAFSSGLRQELAGSGVTVTTIVPGLMRTGSPTHAHFGGDAAAEYAWFAAGDVTPITAMSARRAAAAIIAAMRRGEVEIVLSWQARLLRLAHALAPTTITRVLSGVNRLLPGADWAASEIGAGPESRPAQGTPGTNGAAATGSRWISGHELRGSMPGPLETALDRSGVPTNQ